MKFSSFMSIFALLVVVPNVASAATCGGKTCASSGSWVSVGNGVQVKSADSCRTINGTSYCAATAARCATGYYRSPKVGCELASTVGNYVPKYDTSSGTCFSMWCSKCSTDTGHSSATSVAATSTTTGARNICGCYLSTSSTETYPGENGSFKTTGSKCYYQDETACAVEYNAYVDASSASGSDVVLTPGDGGTVN